MTANANFFDLFAPNPTAPAGNAPKAEQTVTVFIPGGETLKIPAATVANKTVAQVFTDFAHELGVQTKRITRFVQNGNIIPGATLVKAGETYQGTATLDEKGN